MHKIVILLLSLFSLSYALYNPFFTEPEKPKPKEEVIQQVIIKPKPKPIPARQTLEMTYFGFVESSKGVFALVGLQNKNFVIREKDSVYLDERILKVEKITSNFIVFKDRYSRAQTVYFSSDMKNGRR
jgi:hypothetical protein